ncbi:MAG: histidinol-phosphate transaminase [Actinomycetota bacterium]|nr:histidinol-phosphate transaminase [Actinomycetota bacterium]
MSTETPALRAREDLSDLERYSSQQPEARVRLNTNESPFAPPAEIVDRVKEELASASLNRYPSREATRLRDKVAELNSWPPEGVWVANGSNEVFLHMLLAFGGPERTVVTFEPTYALHSTLSQVTGTRVHKRPRSPDFLIDLEDALDTIASVAPDIVMVCSPNNPSGGCEPLGTVRTLLESSPGLVVVDEAYIEFATEEESVRSLLDENRNLVLVKTLSKAWSLAGLRLGYLLAHPEIVAEMEPIRIPYHLSTVAQAAGEAALDGAAFLKEAVETIALERDRIAVSLQKMGLTTFPSRANFVLFRVDDADEVWSRLLEREVLVRNLSDQPGLEGCLRVTAGRPQENDAFLAALQEALDG